MYMSTRTALSCARARRVMHCHRTVLCDLVPADGEVEEAERREAGRRADVEGLPARTCAGGRERDEELRYVTLRYVPLRYIRLHCIT